MASKLRTVIYLFRNDLRIHDNEALLWAHRNSDLIVPLYCFDPDHFKGTWHFNFAKTEPKNKRFEQLGYDSSNFFEVLGSIALYILIVMPLLCAIGAIIFFTKARIKYKWI